MRTGVTPWRTFAWLCLAVSTAPPVGSAAAPSTAELGRPLELPAGKEITAPWQAKVFLSEPRQVEAATFRLADDDRVGRILAVGPWLAGQWSARVQYARQFPPQPTEIVGMYRTVDLLPTEAEVRAEFFNAEGKRLNQYGYWLAPSADWKEFRLRFDKFPAGTAGVEYAFGLASRTHGQVWFARLSTQAAAAHPLADLAAPRLTRVPPPSTRQASGYFRVQRAGDTWWLIDPDGKPTFSLATPVPSPPANDPQAAVRRVDQIRAWGFNGLAGWHNLQRYARYNEEEQKAGRPTISQFAVINFHDSTKYGRYAMLTDRAGQMKDGEHGFPDPFDPAFVEAAQEGARHGAAGARLARPGCLVRR